MPTSIKFHQGYPAAWQCRLIWNRAQGGRATIWVIWLLHRIEPTVLGLFPILSTKKLFLPPSNIRTSTQLVRFLRSRSLKPIKQWLVPLSSQCWSARRTILQPPCSFLCALGPQASCPATPRRSKEALKTPCCKKCHNVSPLFAEERIRGYVPLIVIDRSLSKWLASFLPKLRHKGHKGSKTTDVSLYSTAFLYLSSKFVFVRIPTPRK